MGDMATSDICSKGICDQKLTCRLHNLLLLLFYFFVFVLCSVFCFFIYFLLTIGSCIEWVQTNWQLTATATICNKKTQKLKKFYSFRSRWHAAAAVAIAGMYYSWSQWYNVEIGERATKSNNNKITDGTTKK